jgi:hypothetical protein
MTEPQSKVLLSTIATYIQGEQSLKELEEKIVALLGAIETKAQ